MIKYFRGITSLRNLFSKAHNLKLKYFRNGEMGRICDNLCKGQIATLLILVVVVLLMLILITVNIGEVAVKTTRIANAADAAALQLASQLSTMANSINDSLGDDGEECVITGWCNIIIGAILALIAVLITIASWGTLSGIGAALLAIGVGMIAGAVGTAVSGLIQGLSGKALWNQILLGAAIGAAIGSLGSTVAAAIAPAGAAAGTGAGTGAGELVGQTAEELIMNELGSSAFLGTEGVSPAVSGAFGSLGGVGGSGAGAGASTAASSMAASGTTTALAGTTTVTLGGILKTIINAIGSAIKWLFSLPGKLIGLMGINTGATLISLSSTSAITIGEAFNILTALTSVASAIYNAKPYVETRIHEAMAQYSKMLTGLSPRSSMREGIFLSALSKVVDDPTDTKPDLAIDCDFDGELEVGGDPCDSDGDGNTAETVPYFQFWWDMRMREVKKADEVASAGSKGLKKVLEDWQEFIRERVVRTLEWPLVPGYLDRQEIERVDGSIIRFLRVIDTVGLPAATDGGIFGQQGEPVSLVGVPFWEPGPTQDEYDNWKNNHSTLPPDYMKDHGFDEVDYSVDNFKDQAETIAGLVLRVDPLQLWVQGYCVLLRVDPLFIYAFMIPLLYQDPTQPGYDPTKDGSFYKALDRIINGSADFRGMRTWIGSINAVEDVLLECTIDPNTGEPTNENFPCRHTQPTPKHPDYYATTDLDFDDEFVTAREQIQNIIIHTEKFMAYLETLNNAYGPDQFNPVIYEWTDSLGDHKVTVQVSHFVIPGTRTEERGNWWSGEDCVVLKNSSDAKGDNTWVKVRREDTAANTPVGILGFWRNRPIERTAKAPWSIYIVGGGGGGGGGGGTNIQKQ